MKILSNAQPGQGGSTILWPQRWTNLYSPSRIQNTLPVLFFTHEDWFLVHMTLKLTTLLNRMITFTNLPLGYCP